MTRYQHYTPEFAVRINGDPLPPPLRAAVTGVTYQDGQNEADRVEISIANPHLIWLRSHIRGVGFPPTSGRVDLGPLPIAAAATDGAFDIDNRLDLELGYAPDPLEHMFEGEISGIDASFPNGGMPTLTITALDYLNRMTRGTKSRGFGIIPDFLVAGILSAESRLIPAIDPAVVATSTAITIVNYVFGGAGRQQPGTSDYQFLRSIAESYDADFFVEGDILYLSRFMKEYTPRLTLTWGQSLIDFSPQINMAGNVAGVSVRFTLREIPLSFVVTVYWDFDREALGLSIVPGLAGGGTAGGGPTFTIIDRPITSPADIAGSALSIYSELRKRLNRRMTGRGTAIGDPRIRAGAVLRLEGMGPDFSADWRVTSATHSIGESGYTTSFDAQREILP